MDFASEIKDDVGYLDEQKEEDEEKNDDDFDEDFELGEEKDFDDDQVENVEDDSDQKFSEENTIWDDIDWNEDVQDEREKTIWDEIDWSEDIRDESEKDEKESELAQDEQGSEFKPNQADPNESNAEVSSEHVEPNESKSSGEKEEFDPNEDGEEILPEIFVETGEIDDDLPEIFGETSEIDDDLPEIFGEAGEIDDDLPEIFGEQDESNESNEAEEPDQLNPIGDNEGSEKSNESDQYEMGGDNESNYDPYEYGDNFEQEGNSEGFYENFNAESINTVLLSENLIYAYLKEYIELMVDKEAEAVVQGEQADVDSSKGEISELEEFLNEERERIRLEQQQVGLDEMIEPEPELVAKEEDVEQEQEEEVENQEMKLEEELQSALSNESIESDRVEEIEEKNEEPQPHNIEEKIEERENKLKTNDEEHDTESEPIAHENELEFIKEEHEEKEEHEGFTKEGELSQISQELEEIYEINSNETEVLTNSQEEELEQDYISTYREKQREIEEYKDPQQELEEIFEQTREIEQEVLIEVEQKQEKSDKYIEENYKKAKKLYNQETGKRPIYSNKETKGFKQWLEQKKESEEKQEHLQIQEDNSEVQEKEIEQESDEGINPKLQPLLKEIIENFNFLENLTAKFKELYGSAQNNQISKTEKKELKLLINLLKKVGPTKLMFFTSIQAVKRYANKEEFSNKAHLNHALNHFFTKFLQKNLVLTYENVENKKKLKLKELINSDIKKILMNQISRPDESVKILLNKNELALKGYNYVRNEILREYKDEAIYSKILRYADIVLKKQIKLGKLPLYKTAQVRLTTQQKLVDIYEGKDYVTEKDKFYEFVNKYRDYEALVYLIKCKNGFSSNWFKGKRYFGYTHSTEKIRFRYHIREAIEQYMDYHNIFRSKEPTKLNKAICIALEDLGYRISEISFLFEVEDVYSQIKFLEKLAYELEENYFELINLAFHKKLKTAINQEIKVIAEHGATSELNERGGGQGGQPYIPLPLYDIVGMIALGCTQKRIWKLINKLYKNDFNRDKIAENTLRRRIIEEFKGWVNAQKNFLKPMVEALVYKGFSDKKIYNTLSTPHSKEGWLYAWWKNGEDLDFRSWPELIESKIKEILKNSEEKYCGIHKSKWEEWVIKEVPNYEIANITELTFETIVSVYKDIFGGRNNILFKHRRETTIKMREEGMSLKEIYTSIFNKTYYPSNFTRDFKTWFDGMTPKQIEERWGSNKVNK